MPVRISPLAISLLALISVTLQGPILCALCCLSAGRAQTAVAGMHAHAIPPATVVGWPSANVPTGGSDMSGPAAMVEPDSLDLTDCPNRDHQGLRIATMIPAQTGAGDTLFSNAETFQPPAGGVRFRLEARATPPEFKAHPPEHPPTA
ncbi:MAG: hypothetical protein EPO21_06860 [Chloroflexota bacterium]|nr:MAG: hypothetical protein EPO21_06860 [Chloroflexota bacterium]